MHYIKNYKSRISKFYKLILTNKHKLLKYLIKLKYYKLPLFTYMQKLKIKNANFMIENNIGIFGLPVGIVLNFIVDNKPVVIPMVTEEPSIVAACSSIGHIIGKSGGFYTKVTSPIMIGQVHLTSISNLHQAKLTLDINRHFIVSIINKICIKMVKRGGGCQQVKSKILYPQRINIHNIYNKNMPVLLIYFYINCCDVMGANIINTTLEFITKTITQLLRCEHGMRIISNLSTQRIAKAFCKIPYKFLNYEYNVIKGYKIAKNIINAYQIATKDSYRACTHNKGIMNGIDDCTPSANS